MGAIDNLTAKAATFAEGLFGEAFTYTDLSSVTTSGLKGVFNQVEAEYTFEEMAQKRAVDLVCVSSKTQWGTVVPANRCTVTYGGVGYVIDKVDGVTTTGEPCYTLRLKRLT
jgi:hypothetical protein